MRNVLFTAIAASIPLARAHIAFYTEAMWGMHVNPPDYPYDNRPETPLQQYTFDQWWFHGHLAHPPAAGKFFDLPAGGVATGQTACNLGATIYWAESDGSTDLRPQAPNYPCPNYPTSQFHGIDDVKGCALAITYNSDVNTVKPEDLTIFSVNHQCVWVTNTTFPIPQDMPPCPEGGCICSWHWIHSADSGSAQMYMNGFRCNVTGSTSDTPLAKPEVPKRCTGDFSQCNQGAQQPMYWFQAEGNNMFNGQYDPPFYLEEWGFKDGAQNGIFEKRDGNSTTSTPPADKSTSTSTYQSTSTPTDQPTSTPADQPTATPAFKVVSTPVDSQPIPPSSSPANDSTANPSPSPTNNPQNIVNGNPSTSPAGSQYPSPSDKPRCKNKQDKKRENVVSRHYKNKRRHAREHSH